MASVPEQPFDYPPLKLIKRLIEQLRCRSIAETVLNDQLRQLKDSLGQRFECAETRRIIEQAVERSPWLTGDAARLQQLQAGVGQTLQSCCIQANAPNATSEPPLSLIEELSDLCELVVETSCAQEELLHAAFPGPEWAT